MKLITYFGYLLSVVDVNGDGIPTRLQMMHVQDATGSVKSAVSNIKSQVTEFFKATIDANPECLVGFSIFRDRTADDGVCFNMTAPLTSDYDSVYAAIQTLTTKPDAYTDNPEDAWSGVYYTALNAGWADPVPGKKDLKVLVMVTNEGPHYADEPKYYCGDPNNNTGVGTFKYGGEVDCTTKYPDFNTVSDVLVDMNACLVILTLPSAYPELDVNEYYKNLIASESPELAKRTTYGVLIDHAANMYDLLNQAVADCNVLVPPVVCNWHYL